MVASCILVSAPIPLGISSWVLELIWTCLGLGLGGFATKDYEGQGLKIFWWFQMYTHQSLSQRNLALYSFEFTNSQYIFSEFLTDIFCAK